MITVNLQLFFLLGLVWLSPLKFVSGEVTSQCGHTWSPFPDLYVGPACDPPSLSPSLPPPGLLLLLLPPQQRTSDAVCPAAEQLWADTSPAEPPFVPAAEPKPKRWHSYRNLRGKHPSDNSSPPPCTPPEPLLAVKWWVHGLLFILKQWGWC